MAFLFRYLKKNVIKIYVIKTYSNFNKFRTIQKNKCYLNIFIVIFMIKQ